MFSIETNFDLWEGETIEEVINDIIENHSCDEATIFIEEVLQDGEPFVINIEALQRKLDEELENAREDSRIAYEERKEIESDYKSNLI